MRIQHNITAMNSYRNFSANNASLSKNLEKLSSGYKVNRAGDDAAGLAISEKMRAQITGLEGATKNAKDGISLIQTAEGALTEVHSMLNRMTSLAEQSANGTYDNDVDRAQLQKEVESLKTEIDRVADSTNYNGIKLLDGSLASTGSGKTGVQTAHLEMSDAMKANNSAAGTSKGALDETAAVKYTSTSAGMGTAVNKGKTGEFKFTYQDNDGNAKTVTVNVYGNDTAGAGSIYYSIDGGEKQKSSYTTDSSGNAEQANVNKLLKDALDQTELGEMYDITSENSDADIKFTAKEAGATDARILTASKDGDIGDAAAATNVANTAVTEGADAYKSLNAAEVRVWSKDESTLTSAKEDNVVFKVDGKKFAFVNEGEMTEAGKALGSDVTLVEIGAGGAAPTSTDAEAMAKAINSKIGYDGATTTGTKIDFKPVKNAKGTGTGGLTLQIGDTAEKFNKMTVSIADMHTSALGIKTIDISTQEGASDAMAKIKNAINSVSDTRGGLGALQNRLDHTINNLGVMRENIQNAESLIRDTDVAEEMMTYTKNNILNQSAQAMLAQANQLPQGVLQLLG